jgi:L-asparaginase
MPVVHLLACGGTIASEPTAAGATPTKSAADLREAVPELETIADVQATDVASYPGFDLRLNTLLAVARRTGAPGVDGVVVTTGTDTLADAAYGLSLLTDGGTPVVVTGAQRRIDEPSSDAAANLLVAARAAADGRFEGTFVAFDAQLHDARTVVKGHTDALGAFESPETGPVATFTRTGVRLHRSPVREAPTLDTPGAVVADVPVVHSGMSVGAGAFERAVEAGADGVVVEATGLGNVTTALGEAIADAPADLPVVVASRCPAGATEPIYGTAGGGVSLAEHGVVFAGALPASKARVALALGLSAGRRGEALRALFDPPVHANGDGRSRTPDGDGDGDDGGESSTDDSTESGDGDGDGAGTDAASGDGDGPG